MYFHRDFQGSTVYKFWKLNLLVIRRPIFWLLNNRGVFFKNGNGRREGGITGPSLKRETGYIIFHKRKNESYRPDQKGWEYACPPYIDNFISSQSVTLAVRSWGTKATWGVRDDCLQDVVLSIDVCYILRQERYTSDSQSILSRVESPWPRTADNDTSVQSQPPWPGTTQWGRPPENPEEVGFLWCLSAAGRRTGCPVRAFFWTSFGE